MLQDEVVIVESRAHEIRLEDDDTERVYGMGWIHDYPDVRDLTPADPEVEMMLQQANAAELARTLPSSTDLRPWCSPIENQGALGSCTAQAGAALVEYFERKAFSKHIDASRLFLYKATRNLLGWTGDTGAYLRATMGAMALFGLPPEKYWPYKIADFENEPPAFCYSFAQKYQSLRYYRLDPPGTPPDQLLAQIKTNLGASLPSMFGFTVYSSISQATQTGAIPFPSSGESVKGGHAIVAVGYDDSKKIANANSGDQTTGALLIRNSWGTTWGMNGYGWLPYQYVLSGVAVDWWTLMKQEWLDTEEFKL